MKLKIKFIKIKNNKRIDALTYLCMYPRGEPRPSSAQGPSEALRAMSSKVHSLGMGPQSPYVSPRKIFFGNIGQTPNLVLPINIGNLIAVDFHWTSKNKN